MVERRPTLGILAHVILVIGVVVVAFPLYIALIASTHTATDIVQVPMPMLPGAHMIDNYREALLGGGERAGSGAPVARMMMVRLVMAIGIAVGKIVISLMPLSATSIAALFVIQFIYGWNQYLWPLLVTTDESMYPVVIGIKRMIAGGDSQNQWNLVMATAILAMIPPALVVILMQKWFVKGLVDTEK